MFDSLQKYMPDEDDSDNEAAIKSLNLKKFGKGSIRIILTCPLFFFLDDLCQHHGSDKGEILGLFWEDDDVVALWLLAFIVHEPAFGDHQVGFAILGRFDVEEIGFQLGMILGVLICISHTRKKFQ